MTSVNGITDWTPVQHQQSKKEVSLEILLGVKTRLEEILLTGIIRQSCHHVHVVDCASMVLNSLNHHGFDVCILAHELSDMSGLDTARMIRRQQQPWHTIPIIELLESSSQGCVAEALLCGSNTFLCAPITQSKILSLLAYYQMKKDHQSN